MIKHVLPLVGAFAVVAGLVACARTEAKALPAPAATTHESSEAKLPVDTGKAAAAETVKLVTSEWTFSPSTITIPAGKPVRLVLENHGKIVHEVAVDDMQATVEAAQDPKAMGAMDEDEMHEMAEKADEGIVHIHVAPGKAASEVFSVSEPGTYEFACEIPGHKEAGMVGKLIVMP